MSSLTICVQCEHMKRRLPVPAGFPLPDREPAKCLAGVEIVQRLDFVTGVMKDVYAVRPGLCSELNLSGHCIFFEQRSPGKLMIIEAPQRRHWWQKSYGKMSLVTHPHPDPLPPDDCGDYHGWAR